MPELPQSNLVLDDCIIEIKTVRKFQVKQDYGIVSTTSKEGYQLMNQPTEDRIKRLEEEQRQLKEEVRKIKEQQTEPIKITRLDIDTGGIHKQLGSVQEDTNILKIEMQGARADILSLKATQSDHSAFLIEHSQRLKAIEDKQDAHTEVLGQLVNLGEGHTKRFDQIEATQAEQGDLLKLILAELRKSRGE